MTFREQVTELLDRERKGLTILEMAAKLELPIEKVRAGVNALCQDERMAPTGDTVPNPVPGKGRRTLLVYDMLFDPKRP